MSPLYEDFRNVLVEKLVGNSMKSLSIEYGTQLKNGKSQISNFYRSVVTEIYNAQRPYFEMNELTIRFVSLNSKGMPRETINYKSISLVEFVGVDEAACFGILQDMIKPHLILTYHRPENYSSLDFDLKMKQVAIKAVKLWLPDEKQLEQIKKDVLQIAAISRNLIDTQNKYQSTRVIRVNNLPNQSQSNFFHMRPKGRDGNSYDSRYFDVYGVKVAKVAPYLNANALKRILCLER